MTDPLDEHIDHPLIGQRVVVVLARAGQHDGRWEPDQPEPGRLTADITATGRLEWLNAGGSFHLTGDDGQPCYGWPALTITPTDPAREDRRA